MDVSDANERYEQQLAEFEDSLSERLKRTGLSQKIEFGDGALPALFEKANRDERVALEYAAMLILAAFQNKQTAISPEEIQSADSMRLAVGYAQYLATGKEPWDDMVRFSRLDGDFLSAAAGLKRAMQAFDGSRVFDARIAATEGRLPQYALTDKVEYNPEGYGTRQPEVGIPFRYRPCKDEVESVAKGLAAFVQEQTGETLEVEDMSIGPEVGGVGIQFFLRPTAALGQDKCLTSPWYKVDTSFAFGIEGAEGLVIVEKGFVCKHPNDILEQYAKKMSTPAKA
jgi:hypothetical protein